MVIVLEQNTSITSVRARLSTEKYDLVIVGAGILGLSHAWHALRLGMRIAVVERDGFAVGASVRNFGHVGISMQSGDALRYAHIARDEWLAIGAAAGIEVSEAGTTVVVRNDFEMAVMAEFAAAQGTATQGTIRQRRAMIITTSATQKIGSSYGVHEANPSSTMSLSHCCSRQAIGFARALPARSMAMFTAQSYFRTFSGNSCR